MAIKFTELPLFPERFYSYSFIIERRTKTFTFFWNERDRSWNMDIEQDEVTPILRGMKLVPNYPLIDDYALQQYDLNGMFILLPISEYTDNLSEAPENLSKFYQLFYLWEE